MNQAAKAKSVEELAEEIFMFVQEDQGKAFISDGLNTMPSREKLFAVIRGALHRNKKASRKIAVWLKKYDEF